MSKFFESKNPLLKESAMDKAITRTGSGSINYAERMTVEGAINKTFALFAMMMVTTVYSYLNPSMPLLIIGAVGGLIAVLVGSFKPTTAPISAPVYAIFEGLFVGSISAMYAIGGMEGIISQAVMLTFGTLIAMLALHKSGLIPVTQKFRMGVAMATGAIMLAYVMSWVMSFFGANMPYLHEGGMIGIGISVVIIGVAALNLLLDFDSFQRGEQGGAPKYMEWLCAMGLLVTLVWLYIEFLRLLSKLNRD